MKKLLLLFCLCALSTACKEEEEKFCWECIITAKASVGSSSATNKQTVIVCDKTESEIRDIEQSGSLVTSGSGYIGSATTKCYIEGTAPKDPPAERVVLP
jgi:hypothetical protein